MYCSIGLPKITADKLARVHSQSCTSHGPQVVQRKQKTLVAYSSAGKERGRKYERTHGFMTIDRELAATPISRSNSLSFLGPKPQEFDLDEIHLLPECRRAPEARRNFWHPRAMSFTRTRRGKGSKKQNHERSNLTILVEARRGRRGYRSSPKDL